MTPIRYTLQAVNPAAHLFRVSCSITKSTSDELVFRLPNWIPGSYMVRDFAKNIVTINAFDDNGTARLNKLDKCRWQVSGTRGELTLEYDVYAWDLSVRAAHLDQTHGFFNGTSVFLLPEGFEAAPCEVRLLPPLESVQGQWQVATSMSALEVDAAGFGLYRADNYDDLIDHPVEMGAFERYTFEACGVEHQVILTGQFITDGERICVDLKRVCEYHIQFFDEPAPFDRYVFLVMVVGDGYGGLEHRFSTSLLVRRNSLPAPGVDCVSDEYTEFLGLCSHEYFHAWNVKRLRPAKLAQSDLDREAHTQLLWAFEGITSYYDDLALVRSGLIDRTRYLSLLAKTITRVAQTPGRFKQPVGESSFDAWTKFYKQDENAPNAIVSYYAKGAVVALALDMILREKSAGAKSLDDLMRALWRNRDEAAGIPEGEIERVASDLVQGDLSDFFDNAVRGVDDLPLEQLLQQVGVTLSWKAMLGKNGDQHHAGVQPLAQGMRVDFSGELPRITHVLADSPAQTAGLSAGDKFIALNGLQVNESSFGDAMRRHQPGDSVAVHAFRRDELSEFTLVLGASKSDTAVLSIADADVAQKWLWN
ncbi:MAG: PDZ domain-containing protein [Pseudomonadota bacterium]